MIDCAPPIVAVAIEPRSRGQRERLGVVLAEMRADDPSLAVSIDREFGQTVIAGVDEAHLHAKLALLKSTYGIDVEVGAPQVAYRERPTRSVEIEYTHKRAAAGQREFARVKLLLESNSPGGENSLASALSEGSMPAKFGVGIANGVRSVMDSGILAGFPVDVKATLTDAAFHAEDSSAIAFEIAARAAAREGLLKGECELMEPIVSVTVTAPKECAADVAIDLKSRGARGLKPSLEGDSVQFAAQARMADMIGYVDRLRVLSRGIATCVLPFSHYAPVAAPDEGPFPPAAAMRG